jgi:gluconokinase
MPQQDFTAKKKEGKIIILTGVAGVGKTTVGRLLAARMGCEFFEADAYHSSEAVAKMAGGFPLTDDDRWPWLARVKQLIIGLGCRGDQAVIACSALKGKYRDFLKSDSENVHFVQLSGEYDLLYHRLQKRQGHFATENLLASQLADLEKLSDGLIVEVDSSPEQIVSRIMMALQCRTVMNS